MATKTYDPNKTLLIVGGVIVSGYAPGTPITYSQDEDDWTKKVGVDGEVARARRHNQTGTLTFTLLKTSESNQALSALRAVDLKTGNGVLPFMLKNSSEVIASDSCWIQKPPDVTHGDEVPEREWTIAVGQTESNYAGD